ncbi:nucleotidyl transferase AbiEii/AbiGii toxin family protein [Tautonia sociabilis]|nr:nucleotidyl transferase AbiEii/AbiGii toxin family protein [Tautonia sociabilis]
MSKDRPRNIAASVRDRLMMLARRQGEDFQHVLTRYVIERLLYRLSRSEHRDEFVLKGAMLFRVWADQPHRPTRDLDLLGRGDASLGAVAQVFRAVCGLAVEDDGLVFDPDSVTADRIREDQQYEGVRLVCRVFLGKARIDLQVDVGFGDAVVPRPAKLTYPAMLELPAPVLKAYPRPAVVAEKFQAMVMLGIANSRMKDFYDLWFLANRFAFDGPELCRAIGATFRRRKTALSAETPLALTAAFGTDAGKSRQWQAFIRKSALDVGGTGLEQVCKFLDGFLMPPVQAIVGETPFDQTWNPGGPWSGA